MKRNKKSDHYLIILILLFLLLFLPALFEPLSYGDECIYLTLGNAFRQGLTFYRDIHDNKPPLIYLVAGLTGGSLFWFRLIALWWSLVHLFLIYFWSKKLTSNPLISFGGGVFFLFLLLIFEGRVANGEVFMMMPTTLAAFLLFLKKKRSSFKQGLLIGALFSLGFLFKVPVVFDFIALILGFFLLSLPSLSWTKAKKNLLSLPLKGIVLGFFTPLAASILYYLIKGGVTPYIRSALLQNIGYLSSWQGSSLGLILRGVSLTILTLVLLSLRKYFSFHSVLFSLWFLFSLFGALLSGRPYPHYLIQVIPALTLLLVTTLEEKKKTSLLLFLSSLLLLVSSWFHFHFWWYPQLPYYQNFYSYLLGRKSRNEYLQFWGERTQKNYQLARFIQEISYPHERIFIWGDAACIYALSHRLPPGRYTVNYHIFDFNGFEETLQAIKKEKPRLIIKLEEEKRSWPELDVYLEERYFPLIFPQLKDQIFLRRSERAEKW